MSLFFIGCVNVLGSLIFGSFVEWWVHKNVMHKRSAIHAGAYDAHHRIHHHVFRSDESYVLSDPKNEHLIGMRWVHGIKVVGAGMFLYTPIPIIISLIWGSIPVVMIILAGSLLVFGGMFIMYELLHMKMHKPGDSWIENTAVFKFLNRQHRLHHKYLLRYNFNTVIPIADWVMGTLIMKPIQE